MKTLSHIDLSAAAKPQVAHFFDGETWTLTYVVSDPATRRCAIIDPVLDLDYPSGTLNTVSADRVIAYVKAQSLIVDYIIETHVHADHLTSAPYLQEQLGGQIVIGSHITTVQETFAAVYNAPSGFVVNGGQFDLMLSDNDTLQIGDIACYAFHVPGHTPACMAYLVGDALFVGDTLFMPDAGSARCDFPGGDARTLFQSIRRLMTLPGNTRVFVCHDYQPDERELAFESTISEQHKTNIHANDSINEDQFVLMREARDATLGMPALILPALQVNMRAGHFPPADEDSRLFLRVPLNAFGGANLSRFAAKN